MGREIQVISNYNFTSYLLYVVELQTNTHKKKNHETHKEKKVLSLVFFVGKPEREISVRLECFNLVGPMEKKKIAIIIMSSAR